MASKKLKLEVELDTAKAKRQKKELETSSPGADGASVSSASPAASRAARQIRELGDAAQGTKVNMKEVTRAFTGMAVGMAANYAAKSMKPGAARDAVEYGGAAMTGAAMGMMAGPIGSVVGALGGILKTYLDKEGSKKQATADFMRGEHDYESARAFKKTIENLTEVGDSFENLQKNIDETQKLLEHYRNVEKELIDNVKKFREKGDEENAKLQEGYLGKNRSRQEALESVMKGLENQKKAAAKIVDPRVSMTGTDALAKVGGNIYSAAPSVAPSSDTKSSSRSVGGSFGFSVAARKASTMTFGGSVSSVDKAIQTATERSAKLDQEIFETLKEIAENTRGGDSWQ